MNFKELFTEKIIGGTKDDMEIIKENINSFDNISNVTSKGLKISFDVEMESPRTFSLKTKTKVTDALLRHSDFKDFISFVNENDVQIKFISGITKEKSTYYVRSGSTVIFRVTTHVKNIIPEANAKKYKEVAVKFVDKYKNKPIEDILKLIYKDRFRVQSSRGNDKYFVSLDEGGYKLSQIKTGDTFRDSIKNMLIDYVNKTNPPVGFYPRNDSIGTPIGDYAIPGIKIS